MSLNCCTSDWHWGTKQGLHFSKWKASMKPYKSYLKAREELETWVIYFNFKDGVQLTAMTTFVAIVKAMMKVPQSPPSLAALALEDLESQKNPCGAVDQLKVLNVSSTHTFTLGQHFFHHWLAFNSLWTSSETSYGYLLCSLGAWSKSGSSDCSGITEKWTPACRRAASSAP